MKVEFRDIAGTLASAVSCLQAQIADENYHATPIKVIASTGDIRSWAQKRWQLYEKALSELGLFSRREKPIFSSIC